MGHADTNWSLLSARKIGMDKVFQNGCPVFEIPWRPLPSAQAAKLQKDTFADFNIAVYKGGVWPFAYRGPGPAEYAQHWPHNEQLIGRWVNINAKKSPFLNNNVQVLVRRMQKTTFNVSVIGVDRTEGLENECRVAVNFEVSKTEPYGTFCTQVLVVADINNMKWGSVYDRLSTVCGIAKQDMEWYEFVPVVAFTRRLQNCTYDRAEDLGKYFPELAVTNILCTVPTLVTCDGVDPSEKANGDAGKTRGKKRGSSTVENAAKAAKAAKTKM